MEFLKKLKKNILKEAPPSATSAANSETDDNNDDMLSLTLSPFEQREEHVKHLIDEAKDKLWLELTSSNPYFEHMHLFWCDCEKKKTEILRKALYMDWSDDEILRHYAQACYLALKDFENWKKEIKEYTQSYGKQIERAKEKQLNEELEEIELEI